MGGSRTVVVGSHDPIHFADRRSPASGGCVAVSEREKVPCWRVGDGFDSRDGDRTGVLGRCEKSPVVDFQRLQGI